MIVLFKEKLKMADEETTEAQDTNVPEGTPADTETTETTEDYEAKYKDMQSKHDMLEQELQTAKQQLDFITPYVNVPAQQEQGPDEDEETFVSRKDLKNFQQKIDTKMQVDQYLREFRTKYPDVGDNGPKEAMVNWYLDHRTILRDPPEKRVERAVEMVREHFKSVGDEATQTAQDKATKNAKALGLSSTSTASPKSEEKVTATKEDYLKLRQQAG